MLLGRDTIRHIPWIQLLVEAALVVLSVLLALMLSSWHQNNVNEDLAARALRSIQSEISVNKAKIEEALSYHEMLIDALSEDSPQAVALKPAFIQNSAWETAQATQAVTYLDYQVASQVSEIHELQETYKVITSGIVQTVYMRPGSIGERAHLPMLNDLRHIEQLLLQSYEQLLALIET